MKYLIKIIIAITITIFTNCDEVNNQTTTHPYNTKIPPKINGNWYKPSIKDTWQTTQMKEFKPPFESLIYLVDLFTIKKENIKELHKNNKKVICHFSAGLHKKNDDDKNYFSSGLFGNQTSDGVFLDIRHIALASLMSRRLDIALQKDCDGVVASDMDIYLQENGLHLTKEHQLAYNKFLSNLAHKKNLSIGIKNSFSQIKELEAYFDFAIVHKCYEEKTCHNLQIFTNKNKPVLDIEYLDLYIVNILDKENLCSENKKLKIQTLIVSTNLDNPLKYNCK